MRIPSLTLSWDFSKQIGFPILEKGVFKKNGEGIIISEQSFQNIIESRKNDHQYVLVLGSPIINNKVDRQKTAQAILEAKSLDKCVQNLNGEFLILLWDQKKQEICVITDRFSSYPVFWAMNNQEFCFSYNYTHIVQYCSQWPGFSLRPEKAYEFFILQRLMGTDTHDNQTQALPPSSILKVKKNEKVELSSYWQQNYQKDNSSSEKKLITDFCNLLENSIKARTSDSDDTGIFLSGGHDSRIIAAATPERSRCYTLSFRDNLEVSVAQKIANICGHDHVFSKIVPDFFESTLDISTELSSALYTTDHALFFNQGMSPIPQADVFLHGHGLDFMFQGMYLHARYYHLFGRHTYIKHFLPLPEDLPKHFIENISFRLKFDHSEFIRNEYAESLNETVSNIYKTAKTLTENPLDQLEYLVFHNNSRHYTFSNVLSKRTCGELRTPSFDNELYDFYLRLPFKYRLHANMMRGAMYKMNPKIANLPAANHSLPAGWGPYSKTAVLIMRKLLRHATLNKYFHGPRGKDRTWPDRDTYFQDHKTYFDMALAPLNDEGFMNFLSFIDWQSLKDKKDELYTRPHYGAFLVTLLSYYRFYKSLGY